MVEEAWVVIWPEHFGSKQFLAGVDLSQLAIDYNALTGKTLVVPTPPTPAPVPITPTPNPVPQPPAPSPIPTPVIDKSDVMLAQVAEPWIRNRHILGNRKMAIALKEWLVEKGFKP